VLVFVCSPHIQGKKKATNLPKNSTHSITFCCFYQHLHRLVLLEELFLFPLIEGGTEMAGRQPEHFADVSKENNQWRSVVLIHSSASCEEAIITWFVGKNIGLKAMDRVFYDRQQETFLTLKGSAA
jgi:hypothetical protein